MADEPVTPTKGVSSSNGSNASPRTPLDHRSVVSTPASSVRGVKRSGDSPTDAFGSNKKRRSRVQAEKGSKGLRHFSMKVCQKVKEKGVTTYNEVADELVTEQQMAEHDQEEDDGQPHGPKNIRRRVYDALNVLMAMNIISKEKKEIRWIGLPTNSMQEFTHMEALRQKKLTRIKRKKQHLQELILQQIAFKNLIKRNERLTAEEQAPSSSSIHLPFIIVNTSKKTRIDCQMAEDKSEYLFDFDRPFEIHDDIEVLKRMGLAFGLEQQACSAQDLEEAKTMVPKGLEHYLDEMANPAAGEAAATLGSVGSHSAVVAGAVPLPPNPLGDLQAAALVIEAAEAEAESAVAVEA